MMRAVTRVLAVLLILLSASGCAGGDTSLYVKNDSEASWYLSVLRKPGEEYSRWVVKVAPGANTFALSWDGGDAVPVTVLALDCSVAGNFHQAADGVWVLDSAPGLTARIEAHGAPIGSRRTTPGVTDTEDCGGFLYRSAVAIAGESGPHPLLAVSSCCVEQVERVDEECARLRPCLRAAHNGRGFFKLHDRPASAEVVGQQHDDSRSRRGRPIRRNARDRNRACRLELVAEVERL